MGRSVYIDRMTHTSSACTRQLRENLADFDPTLPYRLNVNGDRSKLPVLRSVRRLPCGIGLPWCLSSIGFGSNVSICPRPAVEEQIEDSLGPGGEVRGLRLHRVGRGRSAERPCMPTSPNPAPIPDSRESFSSRHFTPLVKLVEAEQDARIAHSIAFPGTPGPSQLPRVGSCQTNAVRIHAPSASRFRRTDSRTPSPNLYEGAVHEEQSLQRHVRHDCAPRRW